VPRPGDCSAGGDYQRGSRTDAFAVDETGGRWGRTIELPGSAALSAAGGFAAIWSVSCGEPGDCLAGGEYDNLQGHEAMLASEHDGHWAPGAARRSPRHRRTER
jgi:hypothetical protein